MILVISVGVGSIVVGVYRLASVSHHHFFLEEWNFDLRTYTSEGQIRSSPAVKDLNGDGTPDVLVGLGSEGVYALNGKDGSQLWQFLSDSWSISAPVVGDLNGDKIHDLVVVYHNGVSALNGLNGNILWSRSSTSRLFPAIGDLDGDDVPEVVLGGTDKKVKVLNGSNGSDLWNVSTEGEKHSAPALGDLTGDGNLEIVVGVGGNYYDDNGTIYVINCLGADLWNFTVYGDVKSTPALGDLNSDGTPEVVVGSGINNNLPGKVYALIGTNGTELWSVSTDKVIESSPTLADLTGDGKLDVMVKSGDYEGGNLYALKGGSGRSLNQYPSSSDQSTLPINNFDDDKYFEVVLNGQYEVHLLEFRLGPRPSQNQGVFITLGLINGTILTFVIIIVILYWRREYTGEVQESELQLVEAKTPGSIKQNLSKPTNSKQYKIKTKDLTKIYKIGLGKEKIKAVDGINLLVRGGIHGFLGPNGAGKTSTMKMITGAISITNGTAKVKGYKAGSIKAKKRIGFMPQNISFYEGMTGKQYLLHSGKLAGMEPQKVSQVADELLAKFDLEGAANREVDTYSGGMKQKLGLAASFITRPEILILDEPTSDLDPIWSNKIISYIKEFSKETSIFVSSHVLPEIEEMCDTITIISEGKILLTDTVENLKSLHENGAYRFIIDTSDNKRVYDLLEGESFVEQMNIDPASKMIHVICSDIEKMENFIAYIITNNISLKKYTRQESSLMDIFLQLINKEKEPT